MSDATKPTIEFDSSDKALLGKDYSYWCHSYQFIFKEVIWDYRALCSFTNDVSLNDHSEELAELKERLMIEVLRLMDNLNEKARTILKQ